MTTCKQCSHCGAEKSLDEFFNSSRKMDGKDYYCKSCRIDSNNSSPTLSERSRIYGARYRNNHPDKVREKRKRDYWKDPITAKAKSAAWAKNNPIAARAKCRRNYYKHKGRVSAKRLEQKRIYYIKHKEEIKRKVRAWQIANIGKRAIVKQRYYENNSASIIFANRVRGANRDVATPEWANRFFMNEAYSLARLRTKVLGVKWVVDHVVPIISSKVCGLHAHTNLRVITHAVNAKKSNRYWPDMPGEINGN